MTGREALERLLVKLQDDRHGYDYEAMDAEMAYFAALGKVRGAIEDVLREDAQERTPAKEREDEAT